MVVIGFKGGLGNQMFQYALYKKHEYLGHEVAADLSYYQYHNMVKFELKNIFPNIDLREISEKRLKEKYIIPHKNRTFFTKVIQKFRPDMRRYVYERKDSLFDRRVLNYTDAYLCGYWQTDRYWIDIERIIRQEFSFDILGSKDLKILLDYINETNSISVHVRRGDYLLGVNQTMFGNICTKEYYKNAMDYFRSKYKDVKFVFFTNDSQWVKDNFDLTDSIVAADYILEDIPDGCEILLMALCKHNIIANSTFSWWGAYLNKNKNQEVVAPVKWINGRATKDIWLEDWIKM